MPEATSDDHRGLTFYLRHKVCSARPMRNLTTLLILPLGLHVHAQDRPLMRVERSSVSFSSDAPLEDIKAVSTSSAGLLDIKGRSFAVQIPVASFQGFNAPLQQEHFNENYMDSEKWPNATFQGRIIEDVDLSVPGRYAVRAKGTLTIKGAPRERIIPCEVVVSDDGVRVTTSFDVALDEHGIRVPRVVQQKIAAVVQIAVDLLFKPGQLGG